MTTCNKCGKKIEVGQKFCQNCGEPVNIKTDPKIDEVQTENSEDEKMSPAPAKNPVPKSWIVAGIIAIILVIGGVLTYQYGQEHYSRRNQIDRLVTVLASEDPEEVASIISSSDPDITIDEETIVPYIETYLTDVDPVLVRKALDTERTYESLRIVSNGSFFFIFDKYELQMQPAFVTLTTNMSDVSLSINDEEVVKSDSEDFSYTSGPLIPGDYTFSAVTELEGEQLESGEIRRVSAGENNDLIDLPIYGLYFTVESNMDDATVYLDEKDIGTLANGSKRFGPYGSLEGSTLQLKKEEAFGELTTTSSTLTEYDEESYYLTFEEALSIEDADIVLSGMFSTLSSLTRRSNWNFASVLESFGLYFYEGIAFDELRPFYIEYAQRQREDEETVRTQYNTTVTNFEQVAIDEYTVKLEVDYVTEYEWREDKENRLRTFTYNVSLKSGDGVRDSWNDNPELFINGFANEEMIYDSNN